MATLNYSPLRFCWIFSSKRPNKKSTKRILSLENEMLKNHADILKLNKELAELANSIPNKTRIVNMKDQSADEKDSSDPFKIKTIK